MKRQFYRVSVIGNCCWKIYDNRYFTGSHQHLTQGDFLKKYYTDNRFFRIVINTFLNESICN